MTYKECQDKPQAADSHTIRIVHYTLFMGGQQRKSKMLRCFTGRNDFFIKKSGWKRARSFQSGPPHFNLSKHTANPQVLAKILNYPVLTAVLVYKAQQSSDKRSSLALSCLWEMELLLMYTFISCVKQVLSG